MLIVILQDNKKIRRIVSPSHFEFVVVIFFIAKKVSCQQHENSCQETSYKTNFCKQCGNKLEELDINSIKNKL